MALEFKNHKKAKENLPVSRIRVCLQTQIVMPDAGSGALLRAERSQLRADVLQVGAGSAALPLGARTLFVREVKIKRGVVLAGHSLGANKVIYYLSRHTDDSFVKKFFLLSPANLAHMTSGVSEAEKRFIKQAVESGLGEEALPFAFMGWLECTAHTAHDWCFSGLLDNVFTDEDAKFSRCADITHSGALLIGTFDTFTNGDASKFLKNIKRPYANGFAKRAHLYPKHGPYLSAKTSRSS